MGDDERYAPGFRRLVLMINAGTGDVHAVSGYQEPGEGDRPYPDFEYVMNRRSAEVAELRAEVTLLRTTIDGLHDEIRKRDARMSDLRAEVERLVRERDEAREAFVQAFDDRDTARRELDELRARVRATFESPHGFKRVNVLVRFVERALGGDS